MNDHPTDVHSLRNAKRNLRMAMRARRREIPGDTRDAALKLRDNFLEKISLPPNSIVAAYKAHDGEIDPAPLAAALREQGHRIVLPVIVGRALGLIFRSYDEGDAFITGPMGIAEPSADKQQLDPDVVLVPLLAFDRRGYRLGYGGGYFDRTLAALRQTKTVLAIGIAYSCQEAAEVPIGPHDARLDHIITDKD
jgi:5-formyltetrahydrofolate cyclo-ligase